MNLILTDINKYFGGKKVVEDFNYNFENGIYALIGPNGSGKTTLMRMITNILLPSSGRILLDDIDINELGEKYREKLGYLPQRFGFYPNFTGWDFMMYIALLKGIPKKIALKKVKELLEFVELYDVRNNKIKTYSGGMFQRLGIAQALINNPEIIIMDEPTVGLDPKERNKFKNIMSTLSKNKIIIISTHITSDVEYITDYVLIMRNGKLILGDKVENVCKKIDQFVWKTFVKSDDELLKIQNKYIISNIKKLKDTIEVRVVSKEKPNKIAENITPNLEDLYLYYFKENNDEFSNL